jgi:hypothetical protein
MPPSSSFDAASLAGARPSLRRSLQLTDEPVLALIGDGPDADALRFVYACGLVANAGLPVVALMPDQGPRNARARRFAGLIHQPSRLLIVEGAVEWVLPAADIALWVGPSPSPTTPPEQRPGQGTHAIRCAWQQGIPTVAPRWALAGADALPSLIRQYLALDATIPELVRVVLKLLEDPSLRAELVREIRQCQ